MFDLRDLPPPRPLPPAVRADARQRLAEGLANHPGTRPGRTVVAVAGVAAAVFAVTGLGAPLLTSLRPDAGPPAADPNDAGQLQPVSPEQRYGVRDGALAADADRCRAATGKGNPAAWQALFTASARGATVVAFRSGPDTRFCELTPETVSLSAPASPPGDTATITYVSRWGTVAGVVGSGVRSISVSDRQLLWPTTDEGEPAVVRDGVFVLPNTVTAAPSSLTVHLGPTADRAAGVVTAEAGQLPAAVTTRTDRPQPAPASAGKTFSRCGRQASAPPLVDAHGWVPGAAVELNDNERLQLARYHEMLAVCVVTGADGSTGSPHLTVADGRAGGGFAAAAANPYLFASATFYGFTGQSDGSSSSDTVAITGLVTDNRVAHVSLGGTGRRQISAPVVDGTFVLPGVNLNEGTGQMAITVTDSAGEVLGTVPAENR